MKELNSQKIQNKLRNKFLNNGVKMSGPETIFFSNDTKNFNDMLDSVDACRHFEAAWDVFHKSINTMGTKPEIESAIEGFKMRITRRFQS